MSIHPYLTLKTFKKPSHSFSFTDPSPCVNPVGKPLGVSCLLSSQGPFIVFAIVCMSLVLLPQDLWAVTDGILKDEVTNLEKLFTGGYMRLGLLGVCGFAAIYGIVKQSAWVFASGILGCLFASFMKDWVLSTFTATI